jgi:hypothetical protein
MDKLLQLGQVNCNAIWQAVDTQGGLVRPLHKSVFLADPSGTSIIRKSLDWYQSSPLNHPVCIPFRGRCTAD